MNVDYNSEDIEKRVSNSTTGSLSISLLDLDEKKKNDDDKIHYCCANKCRIITFVSIIIIILLSQFVIIPAVIQSMVNSSGLDIKTILITNPTDTTFNSQCVEEFTNTGSLSATAKMKKITIGWDHSGGGDAIELTEFNDLTVGGDEKWQSMISTATVINSTILSNINTYAISNEDLQWHLTGYSDIYFLGIPYEVTINKKATLNGYNSFSVSPIVHSLNTILGTTENIVTTINLTMTSLASIQMELGQSMEFIVTSNDIQIGVGSIPNYSIYNGPNNLLANITLSYSNTIEYDQLMAILSNFTSGISSPIVMKAFSTTPSVSWLTQSLNSVKMNTVMPPSSDPFVKSFTIYYPNICSNVNKNPQITLTMYNPEAINISINYIYGKLYSGTQQIGYINTFQNITIEPKQTIITPRIETVPLGTGPSSEAYVSLCRAGGGFVNTHDSLLMDIGGFAANFSYVQNNVNISFISDPNI
jgi:hypothetical protein